VVLRIKEDSNISCDNMSCAGDANYVQIDQGDGTRAHYLHLKQNGALVNVGDKVCKGQPIGLTGSTGWTSGPHLHLEVSDIFGESLPIVFDELPDPSAPVAGPTYTSSNAAPASCTENLSDSVCPADTFQHMGITLDPVVPCAAASYGQMYPVTGKSQIPGSKIMIATLLTATDMWSVTCVQAGADGKFSGQISWSAMTAPIYSHLMISVANQNCVPYQGWSTSVRVELH
jgi:murein DD-endopeptidase MepM/ murein hydrolase activator NlpD